jgi:signal peptidase II
MSPRLLGFVLAAAAIAVDRATKLWIQAAYSLYDSSAVIPGLVDIVHSENPGMAFGLLSDSDSPWRGFLLIGVSLVILVVISRLLWQTSGSARRQPVALGLVMGGAIGNLYDRIVRGSVTDFIDVHIGVYHWPTFNVADSAITIGALLLAADLWLQSKPAPRQEEA